MKAVGKGLSLMFSGPIPTISLWRPYSKLLADRSSTALKGPPELCSRETKTCSNLITRSEPSSRFAQAGCGDAAAAIRATSKISKPQACVQTKPRHRQSKGPGAENEMAIYSNSGYGSRPTKYLH